MALEHKVIDYEELVSVVDSARFRQYEPIVFQDMTFLLIYFKDTNLDPNTIQVFNARSTVADWDIYVPANLVPKDFRKACLLHELLEVSLYISLCRFPDVTEEVAKGQARKIASQYDQKYARDTLSPERYQEYLRFKQELAEKHPSVY